MITQLSQVVVRSATDDDLQRLANLVHFEAHVHRHLDWRPPLDWVGHHPYLVAEQNGTLFAALACPPDPPGVAWIRLFAVSSDFSIRTAWEKLWGAACERLFNPDDRISVAAIPLHTWFRNLLEGSRFVHTHGVVVLSWKRAPVILRRASNSWAIRQMEAADLEAVEAVDISAFSLVWQNSRENLELAFRQSAVASVVEYRGQIVGYQISTATPMGGHLARLAVLPALQGRGIGKALLNDLLFQFEQRGAQTVTVNTQHDNLNSLSLYEKAGFKRTGEEYPVYQYELE